jgi:hypothetical protein
MRGIAFKFSIFSSPRRPHVGQASLSPRDLRFGMSSAIAINVGSFEI